MFASSSPDASKTYTWTVESVLEQYEATVRPMHYQFVEPSKRYADLIIPEGNQGNLEIALEILIDKIRSAVAV